MAMIGSRGAKLTLLVRQGATLIPRTCQMKDGNGVPIDLSGAQVRSKIRKDYASATAYLLTCAITDAAQGKFEFSVSATVSASMPYLGDMYEPANQYVWDLEIEFPNGTVMPVYWGPVKLAGEATR